MKPNPLYSVSNLAQLNLNEERNKMCKHCFTTGYNSIPTVFGSVTGRDNFVSLPIPLTLSQSVLQRKGVQM